jgi:hypothetical protein
MGPHSDDLYRLKAVENLVDQTVLNADPSRTSTREIAHKFFVRWGIPVRVFAEEIQQATCLRFETGLGDFLRVFFGLFDENPAPTHLPSSSSHFSIGVFRPFLMDSRMPGIDERKLKWNLAKFSPVFLLNLFHQIQV